MGLSLLFVESDKYFRDAISSRLNRNEFRFFGANQIGAATAILSQKPIDVGLVDLSSLKIEGVRIVEEIKRIKPHVEIITINTYDYFNNSIAAMKAGVFDDFLIPVEINTLIRSIQAAGAHKIKREKKRRPLLRKCQDAMMAVAFAEVGELTTAQLIAETGGFSHKPEEKRDGQG
jgi:DNA-binding NtrC family response regulator